MTINAINLGSSFTNANGTPVLSGFASGLDTNSIINSLVAAQTTQVTTLQDQVTVNNTKSSSLSSLSSLLSQFQTAAAALAAPSSPDTTTNVFAFRTATINSNTSQAASNYLTATTSSLATPGSYTISNITSVAEPTIQETSAFSIASPDTSVVTSTPTAGSLTAGTFTVNGQSITLTANETLSQVAAAFNNVSTNTGIAASTIKVANGSYKLIFTSTSSGTANSFDFSGNANITSGKSDVFSQISFATDQSASDAVFQFNGVSVTRPSNTVSDLVSGVTFNLLQNTNNETNPSFTINVQPDTTSISNGITNFVNAYNNFLSFYATQTQIDPTTGQPASGATLYNDTSLDTIHSEIVSAATSIVSGLSGNNNLADLGISFTDVPATSTSPEVDNELSIDSSTLNTALTNNLSDVENIFGYNTTTSSSNLAVYSPPTNASSIPSYTVNVDQVNGVYTAQYTDSSGNQQTVNLTQAALGSANAISLSAPSNSALAGLQLIYGGGGSQSGITVTSTNGIANQLSSFLTSVTDPNTGLIATEQNTIATQNTTTQTQITTINTQIATQKQTLLTKFSQLESAISSANSTLNYLNAQQLAASGNP